SRGVKTILRCCTTRHRAASGLHSAHSRPRYRRYGRDSASLTNVCVRPEADIPYNLSPMSWRPRFHHLKHPRPRPRVKQSHYLFHASHWSSMSETSLILAIVKLGTEERLAVGPTRVRFRA